MSNSLNQRVNHLFIAFDNFDNFLLANEYKLSAVANLFETYDENKFRKHF